MLKQRNQSGTGQKTSIVEVLMTPEISMLIVLVILCVYTNIYQPRVFCSEKHPNHPAQLRVYRRTGDR